MVRSQKPLSLTHMLHFVRRLTLLDVEQILVTLFDFFRLLRELLWAVTAIVGCDIS